MLSGMRIKQTRRRLAAAAITPVVVLALAACNGDDDGSKASDEESTSQAASESSDPTPSTTSESPSAEESTAPDVPAGNVSAADFTQLVSDGIEKSTSAKFAMKVTASGMSIDATGEMDYSQAKPATHMKMKMGQMGDMEAVMVDDVMYMKMPAAAGGAGGKWMKMSVKDALGGQAGGNMGALDLRKSLELFTQGVKSVESKGSESIDGVDTTHYVVTADLEAISNLIGGSASTAQMPKTVTYDVWLDGEGRFTQMKADLQAAGKIEMNLTDWGTEVDIKAPPASQVTEMPATGTGS